MSFSIFRYAALNKLSEDEYDDNDEEDVPNIIAAPVENKTDTVISTSCADDVFESDAKNTMEKNNNNENDLHTISTDNADDESDKVMLDLQFKTNAGHTMNKEVVCEVCEECDKIASAASLVGGDNKNKDVAYDVSFTSSFPYIVAKVVLNNLIV